MNGIIYLLYNNTKKSSKIPTDYNDLLNIFINEFNESRKKEFIFKIQNKNDVGQIINKDAKNYDFKTGMMIYVSEKKIEENNFQNPLSSIKTELEYENKKIQILNKQYDEQVKKNKELLVVLNEKKQKNKKMKETVEILNNELDNIKNNKQNKKKKDFSKYKQELKKLQEKFDNENNNYNKEIDLLKKSNANLINKIEKLKLNIKQENEIKNKLILEQNELLNKKNQNKNKSEKPKLTKTKTKAKINFINKIIKEEKLVEKDEIIEKNLDMKKIKSEEEKVKKEVFEHFRKRFKELKKINNLTLISNKGKNDLEINSQLKKRKNILNGILLNLKNNKIKIEKDFNLELKNLSKNEKIIYEYECTNLLILQQSIDIGTAFVGINLILKNKGVHQWPKKETKLIFDKTYQLKGKNVELNPLKPNEEQNCVIKIEGLGKLPAGEYFSGVWFNVNGINYGNMIKIKIIINKKEENPIKKCIEKIKAFREEYSLSEEDYSDEDLYNILLSNNFNFTIAFACLFGD